jgi:hypothetical protein
VTLVLDHIEPDLETRLRGEARRRGVAPEEVALEVLWSRFGQDRQRFSDADFLIGVWSDDEFEQFQKDIAVFNQVDAPTDR